jgi:hypothetical protein
MISEVFFGSDPNLTSAALIRAGRTAANDNQRRGDDQAEALLWALICAAWPSWRSMNQ